MMSEGSSVRESTNSSWDETYLQVLRDIRELGTRCESRTGEVIETLGYQFSLDEPRSRCLQNSIRQFNIFQALGHWLWIMAGRMDYDFISFYNPAASHFTSDGFRLNGAYGPRINGAGVYNQIERIVQRIQERPWTRRAIAPVFVPAYDQFPLRHQDQHSDEIPCPLAFHFLPRDGKLNFITYMRAQCVYGLLPMDLFNFTLIHEYVAAETSLDVGQYKHYSGSIHIYADNLENAEQIVEAGTPSYSPLMPSIPCDQGLQRDNLKEVLSLEAEIRKCTSRTERASGELAIAGFIDEMEDLPRFWRLVAEMVLFWGCFQLQDIASMEEIRGELHASVTPFAERSIRMAAEMD